VRVRAEAAIRLPPAFRLPRVMRRGAFAPADPVATQLPRNDSGAFSVIEHGGSTCADIRPGPS
jgi:hypothetical protein